MAIKTPSAYYLGLKNYWRVMARKKLVYPKYSVWWTTTSGSYTRHTSKKKRIINWVDRLATLKTFKSCSWRITYGPPVLTEFRPQTGAKYDHYDNESIEYTDPVEASNELALFIDKKELKAFKVPIHPRS